MTSVDSNEEIDKGGFTVTSSRNPVEDPGGFTVCSSRAPVKIESVVAAKSAASTIKGYIILNSIKYGIWEIIIEHVSEFNVKLLNYSEI